MRTVRVEVTAEDIEKGKIGAHCQCPIALAATRVGFPDVSIGRNYFFPHRHRGEHVLLPFKAREFVARFDRGEVPEPFSFDLELP